MTSVRMSLTLALLVASVAITGCASKQDVSYVDAGHTYDTASLQTLLDHARVPESVRGRPVTAAAELRHKALVELRSQGRNASAAADVITKLFPVSVRSVPVYAERASVNGIDSLILIEAWGDTRELLSATRLWVIDLASEQITYSASASAGAGR